MRLKITNKKDDQEFIREFDSYTDCRHWIINHLDQSKGWQVQDITVNPSKEDTTFGGVDITEMLADDCIKTPDQFTDNQVAAWILYELKENATYYPKGITLENIKRQIDGCFPFGDKRRQTTFMLALNMIDTVNL